MTAFVIILLILTVITTLLLFSVNLYIDYNLGNITVWLKYLFIKIPIYPRKKESKKKNNPPQKVNKEPKKKTEEKKENFFISLAETKGLGAVVYIFAEILRLVKSFSLSVIKHLKMKNIKLDITAGGENAADAAVNFGNACSVVYPILGTLSGIIKFLSVPQVNIKVDYDKKETTSSLLLHLKIRLIFIIVIILFHGIKGILLYINTTKTDNIKEQEVENKTS